MSKLVECPNCLGTGEEILKRRARACSTCGGVGKVDNDIAEAYESQLGFTEY